MQLIKIVPCGSLAQKYSAFEVGATTAFDAIEGWSRQVSPSGRIEGLVEAVGFPTEEILRAELPEDVDTIYLYPAMYGGGGVARFVGIIVGAAMLAAAFIVNPALGSALAVSLAVGGGSMILMGIINLFMPQPSVSKSEDPPASKYIGSGGNTTRIGTVIGIGGGRVMIGGQYLSVQVNAKDMVYGSFPENAPT